MRRGGRQDRLGLAEATIDLLKAARKRGTAPGLIAM